MTAEEKKIILEKSRGALDEIKPYLHEDGGDAVIKDFTDDGIVIIEFQGNCVNCSMNNMTLRGGIEQTIMSKVQEVKGVRTLNADE